MTPEYKMDPVFIIAYVKISSTDNLFENYWVVQLVRQDDSIVILARDTVLSFAEAHSYLTMYLDNFYILEYFGFLFFLILLV